jgi:hypothetical protein
VIRRAMAIGFSRQRGRMNAVEIEDTIPARAKQSFVGEFGPRWNRAYSVRVAGKNAR